MAQRSPWGPGSARPECRSLPTTSCLGDAGHHPPRPGPQSLLLRCGRRRFQPGTCTTRRKATAPQQQPGHGTSRPSHTAGVGSLSRSNDGEAAAPLHPGTSVSGNLDTWGQLWCILNSCNEPGFTKYDILGRGLECTCSKAWRSYLRSQAGRPTAGRFLSRLQVPGRPFASPKRVRFLCWKHQGMEPSAHGCWEVT